MNGKRKGSAFERDVCKKLSLWVSKGKHSDLYWRSAMSGGRATVIRQRGGQNRQAGDICSVAPEGHVLTDFYFIECKHVRNIALERFILFEKGPIANWWRKAQKEATAHDREPVLIMKGNRMPVIVLTDGGPNNFNLSPVATLRGGYTLGLFDRAMKTPFRNPAARPLILKTTPVKGKIKSGMKVTYPDGKVGKIL